MKVDITTELPIIECRYAAYDEKVWERLDYASLVDVATGGAVLEPTQVKVCWDSEAFYVQFACVDDYAVANYENRDDPLYLEDVVEVFIDEQGDGRHYLELELSPANVVFDAKIDNDQGKYDVHEDWDAVGLVTTVRTEGNMRIYDWKLPFVNFRQTPDEGTRWRINFYRIDEDRNGQRSFQAWSPTGAVNYHVPSRFGTVVFTKTSLPGNG